MLLLISSFAAAFNFWLLLAFALRRCLRDVPWWLLAVMIPLQAGVYTWLNLHEQQEASLHFMTLVTAVVALPIAWLFWFHKAGRTVSDQAFAIVMLCYFCLS